MPPWLINGKLTENFRGKSLLSLHRLRSTSPPVDNTDIEKTSWRSGESPNSNVSLQWRSRQGALPVATHRGERPVVWHPPQRNKATAHDSLASHSSEIRMKNGCDTLFSPFFVSKTVGFDLLFTTRKQIVPFAIKAERTPTKKLHRAPTIGAFGD